MQISGKNIRCSEISMDLHGDGVTFSDADQKGVLSYEIEGRECQLPFGIGHLEEGEFPIYKEKCASSGSLDGSKYAVYLLLADRRKCCIHPHPSLFLRGWTDHTYE